MAVCIECKRDLPVEDFAVDKRNKTGRRGVCRACVRARYAARYRDKSKEYYQRNADKLRAEALARSTERYAAKREDIKAALRAARAADPEAFREKDRQRYERNREKVLAAQAEAKRRETPEQKARRAEVQREYRKRNAERIKATIRKRYAENPEGFKRRSAKWLRENSARRAQYYQQYRARLLAAPGRGVTPADWRQILACFDYSCAYCSRSDVALTMDHVVPLTRGGWHDPNNIVPACQSCNSKKRDKTLLEFLAPELVTR